MSISYKQLMRQRLDRALYKKAKFIILGEPTPVLDAIAEADIYNRYTDLTKERTSVFISHRLASCRFCDRIVVLDNVRLFKIEAMKRRLPTKT